MQQIQFGSPVKKTETKNRIHVKENRRFCLTSAGPFEEILKVRVQKFRGCRGYLPEAKSH